MRGGAGPTGPRQPVEDIVAESGCGQRDALISGQGAGPGPYLTQ
jgi:hypothetical protein